MSQFIKQTPAVKALALVLTFGLIGSGVSGCKRGGGDDSADKKATASPADAKTQKKAATQVGIVPAGPCNHSGNG